MDLPPTNLRWFADTLSDTVQALIEAWNDSGSSGSQDELSPRVIQGALQQLVDVLQCHEWRGDPATEPATDGQSVNVTELGEYGLNMLNELFGMARDLGMGTTCTQLEDLALCLGLWVVGQEGELTTIELLVNSVARIANRTGSNQELERLVYLMEDLLDAIPPTPAEEKPATGPSPRKLLLLNRAIVATRSLAPTLMERAFNDVVEQMPQEAPGFFREGMDQVRIQNYPKPVSEVIERFLLDCSRSQTLH